MRLHWIRLHIVQEIGLLLFEVYDVFHVYLAVFCFFLCYVIWQKKNRGGLPLHFLQPDL